MLPMALRYATLLLILRAIRGDTRARYDDIGSYSFDTINMHNNTNASGRQVAVAGRLDIRRCRINEY